MVKDPSSLEIKHTDIDEWKVEAGGDFKKLKRNAILTSTEMAT